MRIVGRMVAAERPVADFVLQHGDDPTRALARRGFFLDHPVQATVFDGEIELVVQVHPIEPEQDPSGGPTHPVPRDAGVPADTVPILRQRIAAYALVTSAAGLLATEFSDLTRAEGRWGLPGGGIDDGEEPVDAVLREIVEETAQRVVIDDLVAVDGGRWIGPNPRGIVEDFHSVRLVYLAHCPEPGEPIVLDVGGTTSAARWVPLADWAELGWTTDWRRIVAALLAT